MPSSNIDVEVEIQLLYGMEEKGEKEGERDKGKEKWEEKRSRWEGEEKREG